MPYDEIVESGEPVLVPSKEVISLDADISEWPWPRFFIGRYNIICITKQRNNHLVAYEMFLNSFKNWEGYPSADLGLANEITTVDFADFGLFYSIATNSSVVLRDVSLDSDTIDRDVFGLNMVVSSEAPLYTTVCNFDGQVLCANISNYQELGKNGFAWSGIRNYEFSPENDRTAGFDVLLANDTSGDILSVHKISPLDDAAIAYTSHGNFILTPHVVGDTVVYGHEQIRGLGVKEKTHIGGDRSIQGFIDLNNDFWKLEAGGKKLTKSGYKEDIEELMETNTQIIVSYLKPRREFYISNGVKSLVINDYGSCTVHQAVSSCLVGWDGISYGTFRDFGDREARVVIDSTDFGSRGTKTLESIMVGAKRATTTRLSVGSYWKSSDDEDFHPPPRYSPGGPRGEGRVGITATEFRIVARASEYVDTEFQTIKVNVKFPDARFRRGISANVGVENGVDSVTA